ncbi:phage tail tube protein [Bacillus badius]|uniref:phage tail tube protein n=1 Tax=Bacillus badius TaxID=1455 RepID=UPI001CBE0040|nr:phage tail tube protein [Bacillus badius]UAT29409.1 phage tail tube protein [Bacillus badius]
MNPNQAHEAFSGTYAKIFESGRWLAQFHSVELKVEAKYDDIPQSGKLNPGKKFVGFEITGSMKGSQYGSEFIERLSAAKDPSIPPLVTNMTMVNEDPAARGPYKVEVSGIKFTSWPVFIAEHGSPVEQEFEFVAEDYEIVQGVPDL